MTDKLDLIIIREAAGRLVARALELADQTSFSPYLEALAQAMCAQAHLLEPQTFREAAGRTVARALHLAGEQTSPSGLQGLVQAIAALAPRLATAPVLLAAIELSKHPLGGDEEVTETLLRTLTTALDRPDLLRPFSEQSFWVVMQHLAEVKAANPDWDWLDLARTALPPDDLVATFRRLCTDPPAWPTA